MKELPEMKPHTAAKHRILKRYLDAWFPILGAYHRCVNYIDGFAGPGEYKGGEPGSPIIAINSALNHFQRGTLPPGVQVQMAFVEADPDFYSHLCLQLGRVSKPRGVRVSTYSCEFREAMEDLLATDSKGLSAAPTFAFVDPFGFKGIPFSLLQRILANPRCEVFINVMAEFVNRFLEHPNERIVAHVPEAFGTDEVLSIPRTTSNRVEALLDLYKQQLATVAKYVGRFDMKDHRNKLLYSLFFASNSPAGFVKMKEAMWSVDTQDGGLFSDRCPDSQVQMHLFPLEPLRVELMDNFSGRTVPTAELEVYTSQKTNYLPKHLRQVLTELERQKRIRVHPLGGYKRRAGTFKAGYVDIEFLTETCKE